MVTNDLAAKNFLELYKKVQEQKDLNEPCEHPRHRRPEAPSIPVMSLDEVHTHSNVILTRETEPRFFMGVMKDGKPVWTPNEKQARKVSAHLVHLYEEKLGTHLFPLWPYA